MLLDLWTIGAVLEFRDCALCSSDAAAWAKVSFVGCVPMSIVFVLTIRSFIFAPTWASAKVPLYSMCGTHGAFVSVYMEGICSS